MSTSIVNLKPSFDNPIEVVSIYASEDQYGLLRPLKTKVESSEKLTDKSSEMDKHVVSEEGIAVELNNISISKIDGKSMSPPGDNNYHLFKGLTDDIFEKSTQLEFKSLLLKGDLTNTSHNSTNTIKTFNSTNPGEHVVFTNSLINKTKHSYSKIISYRDFVDDVSRGIELFEDFNSNIVINKIEIMIIEPFSYSVEVDDELINENSLSLMDSQMEENLPYFSIGTSDENKDNVVKKFLVLDSENYILNLEYGELYEHKIFISNSVPKLFNHSERLNSVGKMRVTIFYDNLNFGSYPHNKNILVAGGSENVEILDPHTFTHSTFMMQFPRSTMGGACFSGISHYFVGGISNTINNIFQFTNLIHELNFPTYTLSINNATWNESGSFAFCQIFEDKGFTFGGFTRYVENELYEYSNKIGIFDISTETASNNSSDFPINLANCSGTNNFIYDSEAYIINGRTCTNAPDGILDFSNKMFKVSIAPTIVQLTQAETLNFSDKPLVKNVIDKVIIAGGVEHYSINKSNSGQLLFQIEEFSKSTDTLSLKTPINLSVARGFGSLNSNNSMDRLFFIGGGDININNTRATDIVDILDLTTDTSYISNQTFLLDPRVGHNGILN